MDVKIKIGTKYFKDFDMGEDKNIYTGNTQNAYGHEAKNVILTSENEATVLSPRSTSGKIKQILELMRYGDIRKEDIKIEIGDFE